MNDLEAANLAENFKNEDTNDDVMNLKAEEVEA